MLHGVVSRESTCIAFTYAALNGLDVFATNAYLQAPSSQKDCIICVAGFSWINLQSTVWRKVYRKGFQEPPLLVHATSQLHLLPSQSYDVWWMRPAKCSHGSDYYEHVLLYTDNRLVLGENAEQVLQKDLLGENAVQVLQKDLG
jgi:hypothetical protein